jgi:hypothetical protein
MVMCLQTRLRDPLEKFLGNSDMLLRRGRWRGRDRDVTVEMGDVAVLS